MKYITITSNVEDTLFDYLVSPLTKKTKTKIIKSRVIAPGNLYYELDKNFDSIIKFLVKESQFAREFNKNSYEFFLLKKHIKPFLVRVTVEKEDDKVKLGIFFNYDYLTKDEDV